VIGNLFKRNATSVTTSELLFFLTPRIIPAA
jgi:type II secretory pathway component GspD/PulD (secretin)